MYISGTPEIFSYLY